MRMMRVMKRRRGRRRSQALRVDFDVTMKPVARQIAVLTEILPPVVFCKQETKKSTSA